MRWCWSKAKVAARDDRIALIAHELVVPDFSSAQMDRPLAVSLPTRQCTVDKVTALEAGAGTSSRHVAGASATDQR